MATITRYVNPDSTAGGDGTTNATVGANRAYVSQNAAEAAEQQDLTDGGGDIFELICETGGSADATAVSWDGWTTSATSYIVVKTSAGHRHAGVWDAAKYRHTGGIDTWSEYIRFEGMQFRVTSAVPFLVNQSNDVRIGWSVFDACTNTTYVIRNDGGKTLVHNCIFNNCANGGIGNGAGGGSGLTLYVYNVTVRGANSGFDFAVFNFGTGVVHCRNVVGWNTESDVFINISTDLNLNHCKSDDTTADDFGGSGNVANVANLDNSFEDAANGDLRLLTADTVLKDAGGDLSSDPDTYGGSIGAYITPDIVGTSRSGTWDIGAFEVAGAAPPSGRPHVPAGGVEGAIPMWESVGAA